MKAHQNSKKVKLLNIGEKVIKIVLEVT